MVPSECMQAQNEAEIVQAMYSGSTDLVNISDELIFYAAHGVWYASVYTGTITLHGTLTQSAQNPDNWSYSPSPSTHLVLVFASGTTIHFHITGIDGYTEGDVDDFMDSHYMKFTAEIQGVLNMNIQDQIMPNDNTGKIEWSRSISGNLVYGGIQYSMNLQFNGNKKADQGYSITLFDYYSQTTGNVNTSNFSFTVNEEYVSHSAANSNNGTYAQDREFLNNNTAQAGKISYQFNNAYCKWLSMTNSADSSYAMVNESYNWEAAGQLLKNGQVYGTVKFDRPVVDGTYGPFLIADCVNGKKYLLSNLLNPSTNGLISPLTNKSTVLHQNYPNPFHQETTIEYEVHHKGKVVLQVFNEKGQCLATLVNKVQTPGKYQVLYQPQDIKRGIYFYRLTLDGTIHTGKMVLF